MCVFRVAGSWRQVASLNKELFETLDGVRADAEELCGVPHRMGQVVVEYPSSQFEGVSVHGRFLMDKKGSGSCHIRLHGRQS